jgi:hypothetical protein
MGLRGGGAALADGTLAGRLGFEEEPSMFFRQVREIRRPLAGEPERMPLREGKVDDRRLKSNPGQTVTQFHAHRMFSF